MWIIVWWWGVIIRCKCQKCIVDACWIQQVCEKPTHHPTDLHQKQSINPMLWNHHALYLSFSPINMTISRKRRVSIQHKTQKHDFDWHGCFIRLLNCIACLIRTLESYQPYSRRKMHHHPLPRKRKRRIQESPKSLHLLMTYSSKQKWKQPRKSWGWMQRWAKWWYWWQRDGENCLKSKKR